MKINFRSSIKVKLITISVLLLAIPLLVLGVVSYTKSKASLEKQSVRDLQNNVEMTIEMIGALNDEVEKGTLSLEDAQEEVKAAILGEKNEDGTRPINKNIDIGENGYMFILDEKGNQLAHPRLEGENSWDTEDPNGVKPIKEIIQQAEEDGGLTYFEWPLLDDENKTAEKVAYSKQDPHWNWIVVSSTYMQDFNKPANDILHLILIVVGVTLVIGLMIIWLFTEHINKPIREVTERISDLASGDLTGEAIRIKAKDETGKLAEAINALQDKLKHVLTRLAQASETVSSQSEELTQSANEVKAGSEQVATTMQELATGAEKQANNASELSTVMQTFTAYVEEASKNGEQIQETSNGVLEMTEEGSHLMQASMEQMNKIDSIVKDAVEKVQELDGQSQEISKLVNVVKDIADQTNLLALNAAIEAARAGEHGQGFAVVADEVRQLAEQVTESVTDITNIVTNIQQETNIVTESLQDGYKEVEQGTTQIETTGEKFANINQTVKEMVKNIKMVSGNLSDIAAN